MQVLQITNEAEILKPTGISTVGSLNRKKYQRSYPRNVKRFSEDIEKSLEYEEGNMFFVCKANGHRYMFEEAIRKQFRMS